MHRHQREGCNQRLRKKKSHQTGCNAANKLLIGYNGCRNSGGGEAGLAGESPEMCGSGPERQTLIGLLNRQGHSSIVQKLILAVPGHEATIF